MARQKKWGKKGYLQDFKGNQKEGYVYTGAYWQADEALRKPLLTKLWAGQGIGLAAALLPGFFTTAGLQNTFYVILPYVFWLICNFYLAYLLGTLTFAGNPIRNYLFERTVLRFCPWAAAALAGAGLTALGLLIFLLRGGTGQGAGLCFACFVLQGMSCFLIIKSNIAEPWIKVPPESK